ncbi:cytochrome c oxidase assembly protein COX20, mitochondrial isoform X2 [Dryobates pubescens]|uniref:cytochrome c oxidase assembly protein COX20, mitochondrial isoform X2 n=1 Tax=Dryobates pubescens TaxID=118200 RepID=UPI0023B9E4F3|nr:cytochrome c oxidase assembly protein COX20, mitochondrial isoform X2 [Dryobates pubescens]
MAGEGDSEPKKSFKLLGFLDVGSVPCARESVLYGSLGSFVVGLGHFLATSRVRRSCDFAVGGFICTMLGYWKIFSSSILCVKVCFSATLNCAVCKPEVLNTR